MYTFRFYSGESRDKQDKANIDQCNAYLDFQFNISSDPRDDYTAVAVASNASRISKFWARQFAHLISEDFGLTIGGNNGTLIGGVDGRSELNLIYTHMPSILILPLFLSNPLHASWIRDKSVQFRIARNLAKSIYFAFPNGGSFAFTTSSYTPEDLKTINSIFGTEYPAEYALKILRQTCIMMQSQVTSSIANYQTKLNPDSIQR